MVMLKGLVILLLSIQIVLGNQEIKDDKTTAQGECTCAVEVNRELTNSLQDCVKATSSLLNCEAMEARRVTRDILKAKIDAESTCECAQKVRDALTDSLKFCVEAIENFEDCESAAPTGPPSTPSPPSPPGVPSPPSPPGVPSSTPPHVSVTPPSSFDEFDSEMFENEMFGKFNKKGTKEEALLEEMDATKDDYVTHQSFCQDIKAKHPRIPSGYFSAVINGEKTIVYCQMTRD